MGATQAPAAARGRLARRRVLLVVVFGLIGLNLRTTFGALPALLDDIGTDLHLSGLGLSLLTAIPVVLMGLLAPPSQRLAARIGHERLATLALLLLAVAEAMRLGGHMLPVLYLSAVLTGASLGAVSTVMPGLIGHHLSRIPGLGAGVYSMTMATGSAAAAWVSVSLADSLGGWNRSLAAWAGPTLLATGIWVITMRSTAEPAAEAVPATETMPEPVTPSLPWRSPTARLIAACFTLQTLLGFSTLTWVAPAYRARGWSAEDAALLLSAFFAVQVVSMLALPALADRVRDRRPLTALAVGSSALGLFGYAVLPDFAWAATVLYAFGLGGSFPLGLLLLVDATKSRAEAARLSAMVFLLSYTVAATGPVLVGVLRDLTGGYTAGFRVLFALGVVHLLLVPGLRPGRTIHDIDTHTSDRRIQT